MIAVTNLLTAIAPTFETLAAARVIGALALPVFWAVGTAAAAQLGGPDGGGKSVAILYASISAGTVIGIPLGKSLADLMGWRVMFGAIGALAAVMSLALLAFFPTPKPDAAPSLLKQASILKRGSFLARRVLTAFAFTSMFVAYTYLAEILQSLAEVPANQVAWYFMGFAVVGLFGNWLAGQYVDRSPMGVTIASLGALSAASFATVALPSALSEMQEDMARAVDTISVPIKRSVVRIGSGKALTERTMPGGCRGYFTCINVPARPPKIDLRTTDASITLSYT